jgi:hypothetical protein
MQIVDLARGRRVFSPVSDKMTNEVIAAIKDDQNAAFFDRYTKYGSVEDAFKF